MVDLSVSCYLSNLAVQRLQSERTEEAIQLFQRALFTVKTQIEDSRIAASSPSPKETKLESAQDDDQANKRIDKQCRQDEEHHQPCSDKPLNLQSVPVFMQNTMERRQESLSEEEDASPINMFDRAFFIHSWSENDEEIVIGTILYNMGLVAHLCSRTGKELVKALEMYKISIKFAYSNYALNDGESSRPHRPSTRSSGGPLLLMALHNNMARIYSQYFSFFETERAMQELHQLLHDGIPSHTSSSETIEDDDYELLHLNDIMFMGVISRSGLIAPAA